MNVPTEDDWRSEPWDLDVGWAYENFYGKTLEEAVRLFEENALHYQEDVLNMPSRVFGYYLRAYIVYLMSEAARSDSDGASCFVSLINLKAEHKPDDLIPLGPEIEPVLKKLAEEQDHFGADWVIYGSFRAQIHAIVQRGFNVSFDTTIPEVVPASVSMREMAGRIVGRPLSWPVAVQVFCNSGIEQVDVTSKKTDILRIFGPPDAAGGGDHPQFGPIPDWVKYNHSQCVIRFQFDGDMISNVTFIPTDAAITFSIGIPSTGTCPPVEKVADPLAAFQALFEPPSLSKGSEGDIELDED